jgi:hypothetical protein
MLDIALGCFILWIALMPGGKFHAGRLGTKQDLPALEPAWIGRLVMLLVALVAIINGINNLRHR